jgi:hypothetical protein
MSERQSKKRYYAFELANHQFFYILSVVMVCLRFMRFDSLGGRVDSKVPLFDNYFRCSCKISSMSCSG